MKPLILVPARGGSKRLPGKNVRPLGGVPMIAHTASAVQAAGIGPALLSTDDDQIAKAGAAAGLEVPFRRPALLADDRTTTADVLRHALDWWRAEGRAEPDLLMVLQPTSPLRGHACIVDALALMARRQDADAVVACQRLHVGAGHVFAAGGNGFLAALAAEAETGAALVPNGALYLIRTEAFERAASFYPERTLPLIMEKLRSVDIDTEEDFHLAESILSAGLLGSTPATASVK